MNGAVATAVPVRRLDDPVFRRWASEGLVWLPGRGMGRLEVREFPYDAAYFQKYERYADTALGRSLTTVRVALVRKHAGPDDVVDIGVGSGQFVEAMDCRGYDVAPIPVEWLYETGRWQNPRETPCRTVTFWDTLEHVPDPVRILAHVTGWVFCTLPVVPDGAVPGPGWKHYRPDEHCWYWTRSGFVGWMREHGWALAERNTMEADLGREDVETFAFRRAES